MKMNKKKYFTKFASIVAAVLLLVSACGGATTTGEVVLNRAQSQPVNTLNNLGTSESAVSHVLINVMEGLVVKALDGTIQPSGAESYEISENGLVYTFNLRENTWANGTPVTAHDYVYGLQLNATLPGAKYSHYQEFLVNGTAVVKGDLPPSELGVKALDDMTLEITLVKPLTYFIQHLAHFSFFPVNEAFFTAQGDNYGTAVGTILENGAFTLTEFGGDTGYTLEKRAEYWDANNVKVDKIVTKIISQLETQSALFDSGEVDEIYLNGDLVDKYEGASEFQNELDNSMFFLYISPFVSDNASMYANKNFRAAVAHAIDKSILTERVAKDGSLPADFLIPTSVKDDEDGVAFREYADQYNDLMFNVETAQKYLAAAKAELGVETITMPMAVDDRDSNRRLWESIKGQIEQNLPGVTVDLNVIPNALYFPKLYEFTTPSARHGWNSALNDPSGFLAMFTATSGNNFGQIKLDKYSELIAESEGATAMTGNLKDRWTIIVEAEEELLDQYYNIPLFQKGNAKLVRNGVNGLSYGTGEQNTNFRWVTKK
jgi:ABC-type oligopeptide transport system, periplasmic component